MTERRECERCHRVFDSSDDMEFIKFYWNWVKEDEEFELCRDCIKKAKKWLKAYLKGG